MPWWGELLGAGAFILAAAGWWVERKAKRADVADKLTTIAMKLVTPLETALDNVSDDLEKTKIRLQDHIDSDARGKASRAVTNATHQLWDETVAATLRDNGIEVIDPPPLHEEH